MASKQRRSYLRLFNSEVSVDASIASSARQVLVLSVGNVKLGPSITVLLGQSKVNDKQLGERENKEDSTHTASVCIRAQCIKCCECARMCVW